MDLELQSGLILFLLLFTDVRSSNKCRFGDEWRGRYYQSGLGEIIIRSNVITTKGKCVEQSRDYYLFDNSESNCFHCLLLLRQHRNIIQYKESYCTRSAPLKTVCAQIRVETTLYTLVREPSQPVPCPFKDAYYFRYNDLVHGSCDSSTSYARPCSSQTKYQLRFNHCSNSAAYNGKDIDMECLASWKDGSETYFYARLSGPAISNKDDKYRCFKYENYGGEVSVAMSADATCRGLRSATDGPFLLELTKDNSGWPSATCKFPGWMKGVRWRDLRGEVQYTVDEGDAGVLYGGWESKQGRREEERVEMRCRHVMRISDTEYIVHTFLIHGCTSHYQCLRVKKHSDNDVFLLYRGELVDHDSHSFCTIEQLLTSQLLVNSDFEYSTSCPRPGVHHTVPIDSCIYRINIGCTSPSTIDIDHSCSFDQQGLSMECIGSWVSDHVTYVVVRSYKHSTDVTCYSFQRDPNGLILFGEDRSCGSEAGSSSTPSPSPTAQIKLYRITRQEQCRAGSPQTTPLAAADRGQPDLIPPVQSQPFQPHGDSFPQHIDPPPLHSDEDLEQLKQHQQMLEKLQKKRMESVLRRHQQRQRQQRPNQDDVGVSGSRRSLYGDDEDYDDSGDDDDDDDDNEYSGSVDLIMEGRRNESIDVSISYPSDRLRAAHDIDSRTHVGPWLEYEVQSSTTSHSSRYVDTRQKGSAAPLSPHPPHLGLLLLIVFCIR